MVRGTGKFKQKRGGGRQFSKHLELDENGTAVSTDKRWNRKGSDDEDDDSEDDEDDSDASGSEEEEGSSEEEESEEDGPAPAGGSGRVQFAQPEQSRAERKEAKKAAAAAKAKGKASGGADGEDGEDDDLINPNHVAQKLKISDLGAPRELTRREKEEKEKKEAKDRYWQLHLQGKTDQAKSDMARLAKIRAEREAAQEKRKAEADAKAAEIDAKKKAQLAGKRL